MKLLRHLTVVSLLLAPGGWASQASAAPVDFELPGTQPAIASTPPLAKILHEFIPPEGDDNACGNCHAGETELVFAANVLRRRVRVWVREGIHFIHITTYSPLDPPTSDTFIDLCYNGVDHYNLYRV